MSDEAQIDMSDEAQLDMSDQAQFEISQQLKAKLQERIEARENSGEDTFFKFLSSQFDEMALDGVSYSPTPLALMVAPLYRCTAEDGV